MGPSSQVDHSLLSEWTRESVLGVFKTTFGLNAVQTGAPEPSEKTEKSTGLIFSEIGFEGSATVRIRLCVSPAGAERLSSIALRMPAAEICNAHVDDLVGEMSNMILGAVKSRVSDLGIPCTMRIPTVKRLHAALPATHNSCDSGVLYFLFENHCLAVEIFLTHSAASRRQRA